MTAYRYVRLGTLPAEKVGGEWRVRQADLAALVAPPPGRPTGGGIRWSRYRTQLRDCLGASDEATAWSVVERALGTGATPVEIHLELILPTLRDIGDAWAAGELTIAEEHRASAVASRLVARLGPSFARRGRRRGAVVVGAVAGDHHSLPPAILSDVIRSEGLEAINLGADTPAASFIEVAQRTRRHDRDRRERRIGVDATIRAGRHRVRSRGVARHPDLRRRTCRRRRGHRSGPRRHRVGRQRRRGRATMSGTRRRIEPDRLTPRQEPRPTGGARVVPGRRSSRPDGAFGSCRR